ncbi:MAG: hypothetical protein H7061_01240, partial [Bdellovibrionaceae bacterium]|nr:hypothetical protein [Bdellovibrio sp.]
IVMPRPTIRFTSAPTFGTCYFALSSSRNAAASYVWALSRNSGWTGNNKDAPLATAGVIASCSGPGASVCMQAGLVATETYYFAVRAQSATPEIGKWSDEISCLVP